MLHYLDFAIPIFYFLHLVTYLVPIILKALIFCVPSLSWRTSYFFFLSKYLCKYKRGHLIRLLISKYFSINFNVSILFQTCHPLYIFMYTYSVRNFSLNLRVFNQLRVKYKVGGSCGGVGGLGMGNSVYNRSSTIRSLYSTCRDVFRYFERI